MIDRKLVKVPPHPRNFIAGRLISALLFWFLGGFNPFRIVLGRANRDLNNGFLLLLNFSVAIL